MIPMTQKYVMENKFLKKYILFKHTFMLKKNWFDKFSILNLLPYKLFFKDYFAFSILLCFTYFPFKIAFNQN